MLYRLALVLNRSTRSVPLERSRRLSEALGDRPLPQCSSSRRAESSSLAQPGCSRCRWKGERGWSGLLEPFRLEVGGAEAGPVLGDQEAESRLVHQHLNSDWCLPARRREQPQSDQFFPRTSRVDREGRSDVFSPSTSSLSHTTLHYSFPRWHRSLTHYPTRTRASSRPRLSLVSRAAFAFRSAYGWCSMVATAGALTATDLPRCTRVTSFHYYKAGSLPSAVPLTRVSRYRPHLPATGREDESY